MAERAPRHPATRSPGRPGSYADAHEGAPVTLSADVAGADELILSVRCQFPGSIVVRTDARITRA
ncbi:MULTISPECIES: hypothetical protein [Micromonospora]|uniref:Uncharacterized protein n=1 Tax=Micromonospora solifontis TaxID=2487138 RepID=A0ABX9WFV2_9ACTN|nr:MULTISPECIES: hypothetical protein [Micromonospora]NES13453.1 hypothetical protein [Micromonospora sp. PPF5-17B]NES37006.1 hypothetical protein [Micromonospora solifontis]NES55531.1 hypothetical protein [Micromonospora sp. PPF5-6]RNL98796.1 hypothetical protein EFE23_12670 [Micromonospora solifontis]